MSRSESRTRVIRVHADGRRDARADVVAREEPLEIRVNGRRLAVTMRTPVEDFALAVGFLLSEGVITDAGQVSSVRYCQKDFGPGTDESDNTVDVVLAPGVPGPAEDQHRHVLTTSACGMCGRTSIDQVRTRSAFEVADDSLRLSEPQVLALPLALRDAQRVFDRTGGVHAAGLFRLEDGDKRGTAPDDGAGPGARSAVPARLGEPLVVREDVGRHNAVDKVLGWALLQGMLPLRGHILVVSARASFELTQKALMAGVPMMVAVSAPSSLAVDLAREAGMTLAGFVRAERFVIYSGDHRIVPAPELPGRPR